MIHFTYGTSGGDADRLNRLEAIKADSGGNPGDDAGGLLLSGREPVVEIDYAEPDVKLDLIGSGHSYSGFDRFGRIVDQKWHDYGASADRDRFKYGYDQASNRTYRELTPSSAKDEFYTYDGMHRLKNSTGGISTGRTPG